MLDVKFGRGSFQKDMKDSIELARCMVEAGEGCGKRTTAFIKRMDKSIGNAVGNWLEVHECIEIMKSGKGSADLVSLCLVEAAQMLIQGGLVVSCSIKEGIKMAQENLANGKAYEKFKEMVIAQCEDVNVAEKHHDYPAAKCYVRKAC